MRCNTNAAPASAVYGSSFNVAATASSNLPVAITTGGACTGSGSGSAAVTMASGTGTCTVYYNQAGNASYNPAPQVTSDTTAQKANATVMLSNLTQAYTGSALTPTAVTNPVGLTIVWTSAPQTNAGSYSVTATINDANYQGSASGTFEITPVDATCTISGGTFPYDATSHGASGSCKGVNGEVLAGLDLGASFTNVSGGTAHWVFTDVTGNYNDDEGDAVITITPVDATCTISGWTGNYDGNYHGATGTCSGIGGESAGTLNLGASFKDVPGGTAHWTFTGNGNYNNQTGDVAIIIKSWWTLNGFFQPVDMGNVWNTVKNGSTVPLKFRIFAGSTELTDVSAVKSLNYLQVSCTTLAAASEDVIETVATGGTVLRYDLTGGQFIFNWKTPATAGKCYRVTMTTQDASTIVAFFKLK